MTAAHLIYIPMILMVGLAIGYVMGGKAAQVALRDQSAARAQAIRDARQHQVDAKKSSSASPSP